MKNKLVFCIVILGILIMHSCATTPDNSSVDNEKYIGTWSVNDQNARLNYTVTITANPSNSAEILLNNFADLNHSAVGLVVGNSISIDSQPLGNNYSVNGSGNFINSGKLEFDFSLSDGIDTEARVATFTK